jgi:hypothetical protein
MIVRLMSDESVESVETGDWPDVEHIHFQISREMGIIANAARGTQGTLVAQCIKTHR